MLLAAVGSTAAAAFWLIAAALMSRRGFDVSDEGFYLLSYRWWDTNLRTFTGSQFLYGPVFEALNYDVAALRMFRLFTVIGVHAVFGWSFMRWLRCRRPVAPPSIAWEYTGACSIVAAAGVLYGWLPLSPGYNDVALLGSLLASTLVLRTATYVDMDRAVPLRIYVTLGPIATTLLVCKWTSAVLSLGLIGFVTVFVLASRGGREVTRFCSAAALGLIASVVAAHLLLVPVTAAIPEMWEVNRLVARQTNSPGSLLAMYLRTGVGLVLLASVVAAPPLLAVWASPRGRATRFMVLLSAAAIACSWAAIYAIGGLEGGIANIRSYSAGLVAMTLVVAGAVLRSKSAKPPANATATPTAGANQPRRETVILALLLAVPLMQAVGTGNPLYVVGVNGFASWTAVLVAAVTSMEPAPRLLRGLATTALAAAVGAASVVGVTGLLVHPYRTDGYLETTTPMTDLPALQSLSLAPGTAARFSALHQQLTDATNPAGRPILAFDEMPGLVLALNGQPVGEAWYAASDPERAVAGIRATCLEGNPWGQSQPILLFNRKVSALEIEALASCDLDFGVDYRKLATSATWPWLRVYVPAAEAGDHAAPD